ncbi:hypothetical protein COOONC_24685 [Cooperia oncophora]
MGTGDMPRVRLRNTEPLNRVSISARFIQFITGGDTWTIHHLRTFVITFFSFALIHAARKTLSTVKPSMIATWTHGTSTKPPLFPTDQAASEFLAMLDGGFLFAYSVGLFGGGILGDRYNPRVVYRLECGYQRLQ